jgi:hypothetical protein
VITIHYKPAAEPNLADIRWTTPRRPRGLSVSEPRDGGVAGVRDLRLAA